MNCLHVCFLSVYHIFNSSSALLMWANITSCLYLWSHSLLLLQYRYLAIISVCAAYLMFHFQVAKLRFLFALWAAGYWKDTAFNIFFRTTHCPVYALRFSVCTITLNQQPFFSSSLLFMSSSKIVVWMAQGHALETFSTDDGRNQKKKVMKFCCLFINKMYAALEIFKYLKCSFKALNVIK